MAETQGAVAESPTAPVTLESLTPSERQNWRLTGDFPEKEPKADIDVSGSSPASGEGSPASTEAVPPASEPGTPAGPRKNAETRKAELAAEIQSLLQQRDELRRSLTPAPVVSDVPAVSSPAPPQSSEKPSWSTFEAQIGTTFQNWAQAQDAFIDARDAWRDGQQAQRQAIQGLQAHASDVFQAGRTRISAYVNDHPDFWQHITPEVGALEPLSVARAKDLSTVRTARHDIAEVVITSEFTPQWMLYLSQHPEVRQGLEQSPSPEVLYRWMGRIEATFQAPPVPSQTATSPALSQAPPPPPVLGQKPSDPGDPVVSASARGDFRAFRDAANKADRGRG